MYCNVLSSCSPNVCAEFYLLLVQPNDNVLHVQFVLSSSYHHPMTMYCNVPSSSYHHQVALKKLVDDLRLLLGGKDVVDQTAGEDKDTDTTADKDKDRDTIADKDKDRDTTADKDKDRDTTADKDKDRDTTAVTGGLLPVLERLVDLSSGSVVADAALYDVLSSAIV